MAQKSGSILIVDDNEDFLMALRMLLSPHFMHVVTEKNPEMLSTLLSKQHFDVVLLDMNFKAGINTGNEGFFWLNKIKETDKEISVVFITAYGDVELAIRSLKEGAADFIQKSWEEAKILSTILSAFQLNKSKKEISNLRSKQRHLNEALDGYHDIFRGNSESMQQVFATLDKIADTDANVMIVGESGTGKEIIAREIHRKSGRRREVFVHVDVAALPRDLLESELFGYRKGAFTDAREDRAGKFEIAFGGSLFLDEISNLNLEAQAKLLTTLQNRTVTRLGDHRAISLDVRIIAATNVPLNKLVQTGKFREDLMYRVNTIVIELPPLRMRSNDIPGMANYFLAKYQSKYGKSGMSISNSAMKILRSFSWPGNIRELEHVIEKSVILADHPIIQSEILSIGASSNRSVNGFETYDLAANERKIIERALIEFKGNISKVAKALGINRSTLYDKIKKYEL